MTTFLLIRHALHGFVGKGLAGRLPAVHLTDEGRVQARELAETVLSLPVDAIYASPLERTMETAEPIGAALGLPIRPAPEALEFDFGDWQGRSFEDLGKEERWRRFNVFRSGTRAPGGETMQDVQVRVVAWMLRLREQHPDQCIAIVSHADTIRAALLHFLGMPLDHFLRIEIKPASITVLSVDDDQPTLWCFSHSGGLPTMPHTER